MSTHNRVNLPDSPRHLLERDFGIKAIEITNRKKGIKHTQCFVWAFGRTGRIDKGRVNFGVLEFFSAHSLHVEQYFTLCHDILLLWMGKDFAYSNGRATKSNHTPLTRFPSPPSPLFQKKLRRSVRSSWHWRAPIPLERGLNRTCPVPLLPLHAVTDSVTNGAHPP